MPELVKLHDDWKERGVRVQTVSLDVIAGKKIKTVEGIREFAAQRDFDLPIAAFVGDMGFLAKEFRMTGSLPTTVVLNAEGEVVDHRLGAGRREHFDAMIEKALAR